MTILASTAKTKSKIELRHKIYALKKSREKNLKLREDAQLENESKLFLTFLVLNLFSFLVVVINAYILDPVSFRLYVLYEISTNTLNVQSFQIYTYANMIVHELDVLSRVDLNKLNLRNLRNFKKCLVLVQEIVDEATNCFNLPILCITVWNFWFVLSNSTCILMFFLGNYSGGLVGIPKFQSLYYYFYQKLHCRRRCIIFTPCVQHFSFGMFA